MPTPDYAADALACAMRYYRPIHPDHPIPAEEIADRAARIVPILLGVADHYCLPSPAILWTASRTPHHVHARWAAMRLLSTLGLNTKEIGRVLGMNHSTVMHGLARGEVVPEVVDRHATLRALLGTGTLAAWITATLTRRVGSAEARDVVAYVQGPLLQERRRVDNVAAARGLFALAQRGVSWDVVTHGLAWCGKGAYIWSLERHCAQVRGRVA